MNYSYCHCRWGTHGEYRNKLEDHIVNAILTLMVLSPAMATETTSKVSIVNVGEEGLTRAGRVSKVANILSTR